MAIIGFNFTKVAAQKLSNRTGQVKVNNNIAVRNIESQKFSGDEKRKAVKVSFRYDGVYEPKIAHIQLEGDVMLLLEAARADALVKDWQKKKVHKESLSNAMNHVLERCNVEAIMLSRDLNLPSPVPLPRVNVQGASKKASKKAPAKKSSAKKSAKKASKKR